MFVVLPVSSVIGSQDWEGLLPDTCVFLLNLKWDSSNPTKINYVKHHWRGNKNWLRQTTEDKMNVGKHTRPGIRRLELVLRVHPLVYRRHHSCLPSLLPCFFWAMLLLPTLARAASGAIDHRAHCTWPKPGNQSSVLGISDFELREDGSLGSEMESGATSGHVSLHVAVADL